jgi:hypothetical protein
MRRLGKSVLAALGLVLALVPATWAGVYTFVDIDYPGIATTLQDVRGLNNRGQIVGSYILEGVKYAFIKNGGTYSTLTDIPGTNKTAWGINDSGQVVGNYDNHGYIYNTTDGSLTTIDYGAPESVSVCGINDAGQICGYTYYQNLDLYGFVYNIDSSSWTFPFGTLGDEERIYGINDAGTVVGNYIINGKEYSFYFSFYNNQWYDLNVPGAQNTRVLGINDHGDIVGRYWSDFPNMGGFVYHDGKFEIPAMPGAQIVKVCGINNAGQIVGIYTKDGSYHGFLGTPVRGLSALFLLLND